MTVLDDRPAAAVRTPTPPAATPDTASRNGFLDTVRAIALVRVILWHAFASAPLSWLVASMPTMFFVAGSLLAGSLDRKPLPTLLRDRLRRLLVPFWVFAGVVTLVFTVVHQLHPSAATALSPAQLLAWVVPLGDPHGPAWEAGWVSTPLWYLRCYLWLLLAAPLLRRAQRRFGALAVLPSLVGVLAVDWVVRHPGEVPPLLTSAQYYLGDLALYSIFLVLGFAHRDGLFRALDRRALLEWVAVGGVAAVVWLQLVDVPGLVVNDSYPLLLVVGLAWLAIFLLAEPVLGRWPAHRVLGPVVRWLGRRSMTVYLWHPVAIVAGYWARAHWFPSLPAVAVLPVVAVVVVGLGVCFGWVEDVAARRTPQLWPGRGTPARLRPGLALARRVPAGLVAGVVVGAVVLGSVGPSAAAADGGDAAGNGSAGAGLALPPAPSAKPTKADFGGSTVPTAARPAGTGTALTTTAALRSGLLPVVDAWRAQHGVDGVDLGVSLPDGTTATVLSGADPSGVRRADGSFPATSLTKSMTAAIVLQLVGEGAIGLDDPLPEIRSVPGLPFVGKVTVRQLLDHTAGVQPYDTTPGYAAVRSGPLTPQTALALVKDQPLEWEPGTQGGYSNSGYLVLGLLAEQLTGKSYGDLLATRVFAKAGMTESRLDTTPSAGWAGFSAGGVVTTSADLLRWGTALYRDGAVLAPAQLAQMEDVANEFSAGLGAFPVCPCSTDAGGAPVYTSIGHNGGQTTVQLSPADGLVLSGYVSESMWTDQLTQEDVAGLLADVRAAVAG